MWSRFDVQNSDEEEAVGNWELRCFPIRLTRRLHEVTELRAVLSNEDSAEAPMPRLQDHFEEMSFTNEAAWNNRLSTFSALTLDPLRCEFVLKRWLILGQTMECELII